MIVSTALLGSGLIVPRKELPDSALASFVAESRYDDGVTIPLWEEMVGGLVKLPRFFNQVKASHVIDSTEEGRPLSFSLKTAHREGQADILDRFNAHLLGGKIGFLLVAPTGIGKTRVAIECAQILGRRTLVVVPKSDLLKQWYGELLAHTDLTEEDIGIGEGGVIDWQGKQIVICIADTLSKDREGAEFHRSFGTIIFDEVDRRIPAKTLNSVLGLMPAKYRVAITATPTRRDGLDCLIDYHVAECRVVSYHGQKIPADIHVYYYTSPVMGYVRDMDNAVYRKAFFLKRVMSDSPRNILIATLTKRLVDSGRRVVVVSDRIQQLKEVARQLKAQHGLTKEDVGFYIKSGVSESERKRALEVCSVVLATYGMIGAGTDAPTLSALILATPTLSATQVIGRIERYTEDKPQPVVVDIVDTKSKAAMGWFSARLREYKTRNLKVQYHGRTEN